MPRKQAILHTPAVAEPPVDGHKNPTAYPAPDMTTPTVVMSLLDACWAEMSAGNGEYWEYVLKTRHSVALLADFANHLRSVRGVGQGKIADVRSRLIQHAEDLSETLPYPQSALPISTRLSFAEQAIAAKSLARFLVSVGWMPPEDAPCWVERWFLMVASALNWVGQ